MYKTLLERALANFDVAETIFKNRDGDEIKLNIVGFHIQQAVELCCKHYLETNGVRYNKTHDITELLDQCKNETGAYPPLSDYVYEHSEMLTMWESKTRYIKDYFVSDKKLEAAIVQVKRFLKASVSLEKEINPGKNKSR